MPMDRHPQHAAAGTGDRISLWPHRSLSARGYRVFMLALCGMVLSVGALFLAMGAWPVAGFLGLEVLVVWAAFHLNYRAARRRETLGARRGVCRIERVSPGGTTDVEELPIAWLRARIDRAGGVGRLVLSSHGREAEVGAFLHDGEKRELVPAINAMLDRARGLPG